MTQMADMRGSKYTCQSGGGESGGGESGGGESGGGESGGVKVHGKSGVLQVNSVVDQHITSTPPHASLTSFADTDVRVYVSLEFPHDSFKIQ